LEHSERDPQREAFVFQLFVAGDETHSRIALDNLKAICVNHLSGCHEIEVVDVLECAGAALEQSIFVTPALIKLSPAPRAVIYGNLSEKEKVILALGLPGAAF
jgi:circadian clock protein KaiB